ncbi:Sec61p translocation complex subunit [Tulasnella sp. JGI-2019a]|nr:Sec61p translocation complex subunit [Tulasnella sp. JGI-2019a]
MSDKLRAYLDVPQQFIKEGNQFITRCTKPTEKGTFLSGIKQQKVLLISFLVLSEYVQICKAVAIGFGVMGFIGYFVKLIHIPINGILVGGA